MVHSHHNHREHQVSHRRVNHILKGEPAGAKQHAEGSAFSKVTSKTAAEHHDSNVSGKKSPKRYARGGKVKGHKGHQTNIAIVVPGAKGATGAPPLPGGEPPMPGGPPMGAGAPGGPGAPPPMMPPGMPMRAAGGRIKKAGGGSTPSVQPITPQVAGNFQSAIRNAGSDDELSRIRNVAAKRYGVQIKNKGGAVIDGESTKADIKKWSKRAKDSSYFRGGAASGVGREEKAERMEKKRK